MKNNFFCIMLTNCKGTHKSSTSKQLLLSLFIFFVGLVLLALLFLSITTLLLLLSTTKVFSVFTRANVFITYDVSGDEDGATRLSSNTHL